MRRSLKRSRLLAIVLAIVLAGCNLGGNVLKAFQVGIGASRPLASSLVASGVITQETADRVVADFDDGAKCGIALQDSFNAAKALPKAEQRPAKFAASNTAFDCFKGIVDRQNFAKHKRFQDAAAIAQGILASLVIFYSDSGAARDSISVQPSVTATTEKELMDKMKVEMKRLQESMKP